MTSQELIDNGWRSKQCMVGMLYFKGDFFAKFLDNKDGTVDVRSIRDDMNSLGHASTFEEIKAIQKKFYEKEVKDYELLLNMAKFKLKQVE